LNGTVIGEQVSARNIYYYRVYNGSHMLPWDNQPAVTALLRQMITTDHQQYDGTSEVPNTPVQKPMGSAVGVVLLYVLVLMGMLYGGSVLWRKFQRQRWQPVQQPPTGAMEL
jgi:hypothetical protein